MSPFTIVSRAILPTTIAIFFCTILLHPLIAQSMEVTLAWDRSPDTAVSGYRIYCRTLQPSATHTAPVWEGPGTECTLYGLSPETIYYFVARAYDGNGLESDNSNEVEFIYDSCAYRYYPPRSPTLVSPWDQSESIPLTVFLDTDDFQDDDPAGIHAGTRWQVATAGDNRIVLDKTGETSLIRLEIQPGILETNTAYVWRARFFDQCGAASEWSEYFHFTTVADFTESAPVDAFVSGSENPPDSYENVPDDTDWNPPDPDEDVPDNADWNSLAPYEDIPDDTNWNPPDVSNIGQDTSIPDDVPEIPGNIDNTLLGTETVAAIPTTGLIVSDDIRIALDPSTDNSAAQGPEETGRGGNGGGCFIDLVIRP